MGLEELAYAAIIASAGYGAYATSQQKAPKAITPSPPATEPKDMGRKPAKKYPRGPAQLFSDDDLRLGVAGKLGKTFA